MTESDGGSVPRRAGSVESEGGLPVGDPALVRALFDASQAGIAVFDDLGRVLRANTAMQRMLGRDEAGLIGRRMSDVVPGLVGLEADELVAGVLAGGDPVHGREVEGPSPALEGPRVFLVSCVRLADAVERPRAAATVVDITDVRRVTTDLAGAVGRLELLGRAGQVLAEPLDTDRTLDRLADLVVPAVADHCLVDLMGPQGLRRAAGRHAAFATPLPGEPVVSVGDVVRYPPQHPATRALAEPGAHLLSVDISADGTPAYDQVAPEGGSGAFARRVGIHSAVVASLVARGRVVGVMLMARSRTPHPYTAADAELVGQIADRAAVAIDTAQLFARQRDTALGLQRSLMPRRLPQVEALSLAARYRPAGDRAEVGGDWYDVVPLSAGRAAVVIGDVMGRGLAAAALMGQVRASLRAYAVQDLPPAHVLAHADELVRGLDDSVLVTCVYGVIDARESTFTAAVAGHVPVLVVRPGDDVAVQEIGETGPPLGAAGLSEGPRYGQVSVVLPDDARLVLSTDGLARAPAVGEPVADLVRDVLELARATSVGPGEPIEERWAEQLMARVAASAQGGDHLDDAAVLVAALRADERPRCLRVHVEPDAVQVRAARERAVDAVRGWLGDRGLGARGEELVSDVELLVSELVTNVVRHAGTDADLVVSLHRRSLTLEVRDGREATPRWRRADPDDEGGRGMFLVGTLSQEWGVRALAAGGKAVWCTLGVPDSDSEAHDPGA